MNTFTLQNEKVIPYKSECQIGKIYDQGTSSMCGAMAGAYYLREKEYYKSGEVLNLSYIFLYASDKDRFRDGMYTETIAKLLLKGTVKENKYDMICCKEESKNILREHLNEFEKEHKYKANSYIMLSSWKQVLNAIRICHGCILAVDVYDNWVHAENGVIGKRKGKLIGRHMIFAKDYEKQNDGSYNIRFVNTWSSNWGDNGCGYLNTKLHRFKEAFALI